MYRAVSAAKGVFRWLLFSALLVFLLPGVSRAAEMELAERAYLCAWVSLASYDDRIGELARQELAAAGYVMEPLDEKKGKSHCYLMRRDMPGGAPFWLLSVRGTEDKKDVRTDVDFRKVPFAGETPEQFAAMAVRTKMTSKEPLVHRGFNSFCLQSFFTAKDDEQSLGEWLAQALKADPEARLCLTGHSLGGAVSVLMAARLMAMGVPAEQLAVVTFGAPAVGNAAFAEAYGAMPLERIVMAGDPMRGALQLLNAGYTQFGKEISYHQPRGHDRFPHEMAAYLDAALRLYYDAGGDLPREGEEVDAPKVYLAADFVFPEVLAQDAEYCQLAANDFMRRQVPDLCIGEAGGTMEEISRRAQDAGCTHILRQRYEAIRDRNARRRLLITLTEGVYDSNGKLLGGQHLLTSTRFMTPLLAALYDAAVGTEQRMKALGVGEQEE